MRIIVPSSNVTGWLCRGMLRLLARHWPGHPPVVIGGYDKPEGLPPEVEFIKIGEWADYPVNRWSDGLIKLLNSIDDEVICYTMDDFWLNQDVDNRIIDICEAVMVSNPEVVRIDLTDDRLLSGGAHGGFFVSSGDVQVDFIQTVPKTPYQLSLQTGLWRREHLLRYLIPGETPAEVEIIGSSRMTRSEAVVLGTRQAPIRYLITQQHGKIHIDDSGYQAPGTALLPDDRAELARLGYLTP